MSHAREPGDQYAQQDVAASEAVREPLQGLPPPLQSQVWRLRPGDARPLADLLSQYPMFAHQILATAAVRLGNATVQRAMAMAEHEAGAGEPASLASGESNGPPDRSGLPPHRASGPARATPPGDGPVRVVYSPEIDPVVFGQEMAQRAQETGRPHLLFINSHLTREYRDVEREHRDVLFVVNPGDSASSVIVRLVHHAPPEPPTQSMPPAGLDRVGEPLAADQSLKGSQRFVVGPGGSVPEALAWVLRFARTTGAVQSLGRFERELGNPQAAGGTAPRERVRRYREYIKIAPTDQLPEVTQRLRTAESGRAEPQPDQHPIEEQILPGSLRDAELANRLAAVAERASATGRPQDIVRRDTGRNGEQLFKPVMQLTGQERDPPEVLVQRYKEKLATLDRTHPRPGEVVIDERILAGSEVAPARRTLLASALDEARSLGPRSIMVRTTNRHGEDYLRKAFDIDGSEDLAQVEERYARAAAEVTRPTPNTGEHAIEDQILPGDDRELGIRQALSEVLAQARISGPQKVVVSAPHAKRTQYKVLFEVGPTDTLDEVVKTYHERRDGPAKLPANHHRMRDVFPPGSEAPRQLQQVLDQANATRQVQVIVDLVEEPISKRYEEVARVRPDEDLAEVQYRLEMATSLYKIVDSRPRPRRRDDS